MGFRSLGFRPAYLGRALVQVVDGVEGVVLDVPAEGGHAAADVEPRHHDARDQLLADHITQHRPL